MDLTTCLKEKLGIDVLHGMRGLNAVSLPARSCVPAHSMARLAA